MFSFKDQVVIVTGAAGNLGRAIARAFEAAGATLVLVDRTADRLQSLFPGLADSPHHFLATSVDLTDSSAVEEMAAEAIERFGRVDVLVNTAGGWRGGTPVHETDPATWDFIMNLNVTSLLNASRVIIPHMLDQGGGRIINVAARAGMRGAAKSAVIRLTESMAAELKKQGVNVNCVLPSTIDTPQNREAMPNADHSRWVAPGAIADVILFLASDAARAIQGAAIPVYGRG